MTTINAFFNGQHIQDTKISGRMFSLILMINKIRTSMFSLLIMLVTETTASIHDEIILNDLIGATFSAVI